MLGMLTSWFFFENSGMTTNDHRLSCYGCAVPPGAHLVPGGEVVKCERALKAPHSVQKPVLISCGSLTFLATTYGKPLTGNGFGGCN